MRLPLNHSAMRWVLAFSVCAVAIAAAAHAEWPKQFSDAFTDECVLSCEKIPRHTPDSRANAKRTASARPKRRSNDTRTTWR